MLNRIKKIVRGVFPSRFKQFLSREDGDEYSRKIYSQEGEDAILEGLLRREKPGFYVDVGAHHPFRFSNTKVLYDKGWSGINIEPNLQVKRLFEKYRPRDVFLNVGISENGSELDYAIYEHPAYNSFDAEIIKSRNFKPTSKIKVKTRRLDDILKEYGVEEIDILLVDTEGFDLNVLRTNNWKKYRPKYILVEIGMAKVIDVPQSNTYKYLEDLNYYLISKFWNSCLFKSNYTRPN